MLFIRLIRVKPISIGWLPSRVVMTPMLNIYVYQPHQITARWLMGIVVRFMSVNHTQRAIAVIRII